MSGRKRLDLELVRRGLAPNRSQAQDLITEGKVLVGGAIASNSARQVSPAEPVVLVGPPPRFVSRGGEKLAGALEHFDIDVTGKRALDVGASTGGFTDCLLQAGAASVCALDVGHSQMHEKMRADVRVDVRERTNIRHVTKADFDDTAFEIITVDVSFISLRTIATVLAGDLASPDALLITLIKPQFEAGKTEVSKGRGILKDPEIWRRVLVDVIGTFNDLGATRMGVMKSPLLGAEGNTEFLAAFRLHQTPIEADDFSDVDELVGSL